MPGVVLKDPELIRQTGVKDFDNFMNHRAFISEEVDPIFGNILFTMQGTSSNRIIFTNYDFSLIILYFQIRNGVICEQPLVQLLQGAR